MKIIKSFKVFESGLPYSYIEEIKIAIDNLLSEERFQPHIDEDSSWDYDEDGKAKKRKFGIGVDANESKFGVQIDVSFRTDDPVDPNLVNDEFTTFVPRVVALRTETLLISNALPVTIFQSWFEVQFALLLSQVIVLSPVPLSVIPPPFAVVSVGVATLPSSMLISSTVIVVALTVVVVPLTIKFPPTVTLPTIAK